jgi:PIN domain nuclease of toxin-antitoxin system
MKLYLDTNIVTYFLYNRDELSLEVSELLFDYANILFTSSICVQELIHLTQIGKVQKVVNGKHKPIDPITVINTISDAGIDIVPIEKRHLSQLASLPLNDDHRDPNDRLIIAQAISDRTALISSDHQFSQYKKYGLDFIMNER